MIKKRTIVYFDWAATAPPDPEIIAAVRDAESEYFGNPSSIHLEGRRAKKFLNQSREKLARVVEAKPEELIFTSGGTESNNMILFSLLTQTHWKSARKKKIIVSSIEHPSVYNPALLLGRMGFHVDVISPGPGGHIDPQKVKDAIGPDTVLVTCMYVNNETGAIQPVVQLGKLIRETEKKTGQKILFHVDAVQGFGKIKFYPHSMNIDSASLSAHKIRGSRGIGALFVRKHIPLDFLYQGGEQEGKRRPGTENLAGCYSMALAAEKAGADLDISYIKTAALMKNLITGLSAIEGIVFIPGFCTEVKENKPGELFSPYILKVSFPPVPGEVLVRMLEDKNIFVSTGSACSSRKKKGKHRVLESMGISDEVAASSIRISIGPGTTGEQIDFLVSVLARLVPELKKIA